MPRSPIERDNQNVGDSDLEYDQSKPVRACQACRASKVRCIQLDDSQACVRCCKAGRFCLATDSPAKGQKRSHSRSMAEQDVSTAAATAWTMALPRQAGGDASRHARKGSSTRHSTTSSRAKSPSTSASTLSSSQQHYHMATAASSPLESSTSAFSPSRSNVSSSSAAAASNIEATIGEIVDEDTAGAIFEEFTSNMLPEFPFVVFPPNASAREVCKSNPITFLAILDVASNGFCELRAMRQIRKLLVATYSNISPGTAEVTLPLLQAFIISACWNKAIYPAQPGEQIDVHQLIHASTSMAILMGLGRTLAAHSWNGPMMPAEVRRLRGPASRYQACSLDVRRIWLGCHYVSSNVSMALQTPNIMRWTRYMDECLEVLETSPASHPSDKVLCRHARLQHILEEFELQLFESVGGGLTATEPTHTAFKTRLAAWASANDTWTEPLRFSHQFVKLYMHEIAMCSAHTANNPLAPESDNPTIDPDEFADCLAAAHGLLDVFISLDMSLIRALPTVYFVRVIYAAVVLVKLHFASARLPNPADAAERTLSLKVDDYLARMLQKLGGWGTLWPAWRLTTVLRRVRELFQKNRKQHIHLSELAWLNSWTVGGSATSSAAESPHETDLQLAGGGVSLAANSTAFRQECTKPAKPAVPTPRRLQGASDATRHDDALQHVELGHTSPWNADIMDIGQLNQWLDCNMSTGGFDFESDMKIF